MGSASTSVVIGTDAHPLAAVMVRLLYAPADKLEIMILPAVSDESDNGVTGVPFLSKFTVNDVLAVNPVSVILPSDPPQVEGCTMEDPPITGAGVVLILTNVVSGEEVQESIVAMTIYAPDMDDWVLVTEGFCNVELKPPGPVQLNVALLIFPVLNCKILPVHNGPLLEAVGVVGVGFTITLVDTATELHPSMVVCTLYVPCSSTVAFANTGF